MNDAPVGRFTNQVAIVTGAAAGVGHEVVKTLAVGGATVVAIDINPQGQDVARETASATGAQITFLQLDVSDSRQVSRAVDTVLRTHGQIHVLVNHAGIVRVRPFLETGDEDWALLWATNVMSMVWLIRAALPSMLAQGRGVIVNTASISGLTASALEGAYCTTKGACIQLTRSVAVEFRDRGIRCNAVCPGFIRTQHGLRELEALRAAGVNIGERDIAALQGRMCQPSEVARTIAFLASDDASFINGEALVIDNGAMALT